MGGRLPGYWSRTKVWVTCLNKQEVRGATPTIASAAIMIPLFISVYAWLLLRKGSEDDFAVLKIRAIPVVENRISYAGITITQGLQRRLQYYDVPLRYPYAAYAAATRGIAEHGLSASVVYMQGRYAVLFRLVKAEVYCCCLPEVCPNDALDDELRIAVMHADGYALRLGCYGEYPILPDAAGVSQVSVYLRLCDDYLLMRGYLGPDVHVQILGGYIVFISRHIAEVLCLPHPPRCADQYADKRQKKHDGQCLPQADFCPYVFKQTFCSSSKIRLLFLHARCCIKQRAVRHVIGRFLGPKQKTPKAMVIMPFFVTVSFPVLWCHVCLLSYYNSKPLKGKKKKRTNYRSH